MRRTLLLLAIIAVVVSCVKIDHFVVLMLENRSFDHMCGWLKRNNSKINGLTGREYNVANGTRYYVKDTCPYINPFDPNHGFSETTTEVMGPDGKWVYPAPMSGFAYEHFISNDPEFWTVMHGFSPERVPAISTLAQEFAVFDEYHASLPGPTVPNRLFFHTGTSHGHTSTSSISMIEGFPQRPMIDILNDDHIEWNAFYQDVSDMLYMAKPRLPQNIVKIQAWDHFTRKAAEGNLPAYTWLSPQFYPSSTTPARDQHPDHDVVDGEKLIAEVYSALRNGPKWNNTVFMITYDEHGGFYDHVSPPQDVPNPDGLNDPKNGFNFTREGVRVCTVLASPWIPKGTVVSKPPNDPTKVYEHTSILNTLRAFFPISEDATLSNRSSWAPAFDWVLNLTEPRTDCPTSVPIPEAGNDAARSAEVLAEQLQRPPNGLQKELYQMLEQALGRDGTDHQKFKTQEEMGNHMRHWHAKYIEQQLGQQ